ncbi:terminase large subunit [Synechococcus phage S-CBWM1]|uniref:Terminase large subunit n=1 Tax=Synechococcus phage S-CBWM1 TaxID=2053653 RepID=A0A3G1L3N7_9CAUD|nr:terminase large subunit [Synechococcus phage S-CBWM1]ATW62787.1 terminase large subunit [Synechococcus phage S-CBWM1]
MGVSEKASLELDLIAQGIIAPIQYQHPRITHASQLDERSRYRKYRSGLEKLISMGAPLEIIQDFKYKAARSSFLAFCEIMKKGDLNVSNFHEIIAAAFEDLFDRRYRKLIISCPPRSGKSMLGTFLLCWLLGRDHRSQHIVASYGIRLSEKFHREAVLFLKSKEFKRVFPTWTGFIAGSKYDMRQGGNILATSVGGILTGFTSGTPDITSPGIGIMLVDDPLKSSNSIAKINELEPWWVEQASTRRTNNYAQVVIATRFHEKDLHGFLMGAEGLYDPDENPFGWRWLNFEGLCEHQDEDPLGRELGESHWPENPEFSVDILRSQRAAGERAFNALYQGRPTSQQGQIVKASWVNRIPAEEFPDLDYVWLGIDTAFEEKDSADNSAIVVAGTNKKEQGRIFIPKIIWGKWGFPELLEQVKLIADYYGVKALVIEKAASGHSLVQVLERQCKIPIQEMRPIRSKTARLEAVTPFLEQDRVFFAEDATWTTDFIHDLTQFPYVAKKDTVDAFAWAMTYYAVSLDRDRLIYGNQDAITYMRKAMVTRFSREDKALFTTPVREVNSNQEPGQSLFKRRGTRSRASYDPTYL